MDQPRRILYIDDDDGLRRLVQKLLERRGHRVAIAASATSTATAPEMLAPTIGMNAPRNTSAASGNANWTPKITSASPMPTASMNATSTVART